MKSHPLRMRGLKLFVALLLLVARESHPLRMRGLKHFCTNKKSHPQYVASFADAWIETVITSDGDVSCWVASFADAWIETLLDEPR